ncbi:MAG TPA: hypothetical protein VJH23_03520 [archaeon]|nr:hypothetical protein [archaeon]
MPKPPWYHKEIFRILNKDVETTARDEQGLRRARKGKPVVHNEFVNRDVAFGRRAIIAMGISALAPREIFRDFKVGGKIPHELKEQFNGQFFAALGKEFLRHKEGHLNMRGLKDKFFSQATISRQPNSADKAALNMVFQDYLEFMNGAYRYMEQHIRNQ